MLAARAALALPSTTASRRCSGEPAPPLATTGMSTASDTARVISISYPSLVPSASMQVRTSSPAPSASTFLAHSTHSRPVGIRPPLMWTSQNSEPSSRLIRFGSRFTTMHWLPNLSAASRTKSGSFTAAELIETLSQPELISVRISSSVRIPPPTVSGMKQTSDVRLTTSRMMSRSSWLAVMSRKTSSSAPSASYRDAICTGSPASCRFRKLTPLTTRPAWTSRQGIIRLASIVICRSSGESRIAAKPQKTGNSLEETTLSPGR